MPPFSVSPSRWPNWSGPAAATSATVFAGVVVAAALTGHDRFVGVPGAAWPAAGVLFAGGAAAFLTTGGRGAALAGGALGGGRAVLPRVVAGCLWGVAGLALAGSCWVLLDLIALAVTGTVDDRHGNSAWATFVQRLALVVIGVLFTATAVAWRRRTTGRCPHCGEQHPPQAVGRRLPAPRSAPPLVRRNAYVGCVVFLPYLSLHILGAAGVPGIEPHGFRPPWSAVAAGVVGVGLAVFLLLGLVSPWGMVFPRWTIWLAGRRVPRFLPLTPVWLVAPTLALYGTGSLVYAPFTEYGVLGLGGAASLAFGGYGWALCAAAVSYQIRTRPRCAVAPAQPGRLSTPGPRTDRSQSSGHIGLPQP